MFRLALNAGHGINTPGRRCPAELDPNQTREWWLNQRICASVEKRLAEYDGVEILRTDDTSGEIDRPLKDRTDDANAWCADLWIGIHHNAAGKIFNGGGVVVYVDTNATSEELQWQSDLYKRAVYMTGLYGNRSNPTPRGNLHELRETIMPAVLIECGFMDSRKDCPEILSELFVERMTNAIVDVVVARAGLKKRTKSKHYVMIGPFENKAEADRIKALLAEAISE